ncbi:MAG: DUF4153 domain-containing protein [bacterium]|nr:DUF4153 domain-containing protein [bacterium]
MSWFTRFPSYEFLARNAVRGLTRFPLTFLSGVLASCFLVLLIERDAFPTNPLLQKWAAFSALGLPLFTALAAFAEKRQLSRLANYGTQAIGILLLAIVFLTTPTDITYPNIHWVRIILLAVAFHCLAAFLPFLGGDQTQGFWQYNKALFLRFLTSGLFSAVMFGGLAIALWALKTLFDFDFDDDIYMQLWSICAGFFTTWLFISGIPEDLNALDKPTEYPRGLRIFTQYILLPLVGLYLVILYAYGLKIVLQWSWPRGWVSQLVLWYSVVSILALLLLWPLREKAESKWISTFSKWFFRLLVPLLVMLFLAIFERIGEYGVTVNRYLVIAMACGLAVVVLYNVLSRKKDIRLIPIVVCAVALPSAYGPQSAFSVAESSQISRLDSKLRSHDIVPSGDTTAVLIEVDLEERKSMSSTIDYLVSWHGREPFGFWFADSILATISETDRTPNDDLARLLGFEYAGQFLGYWDQNWQGKWFNRNYDQHLAVDVSSYQYLIPLDFGYSDRMEIAVTRQLGADSLSLTFQQRTAELAIQWIADSSETEALKFDLTQEMIAAAAKYMENDTTKSELHLRAENAQMEALLIVLEVNGQAASDSAVVGLFQGELLIRKK